ncbi:hypothetical protein DFH28DRAFT_1125108 [Melampsora americana]|nr:hypothetical protein DFH28DRAFT_1125108 [Melampsora americana]
MHSIIPDKNNVHHSILSVHNTPILDTSEFISPHPKRSGFIFTSSYLEKVPNYDHTTPVLNYQPEFPMSPPPSIIKNLPMIMNQPIILHEWRIKDLFQVRILNYKTIGQLLDRRSPTVVIFIRNFRCAFRQTYIQKLFTIFNECEEYEPIKSAGIKVIIISLGSHSMISKYGKLLSLPPPNHMWGEGMKKC